VCYNSTKTFGAYQIRLVYFLCQIEKKLFYFTLNFQIGWSTTRTTQVLFYERLDKFEIISLIIKVDKSEKPIIFDKPKYEILRIDKSFIFRTIYFSILRVNSLKCVQCMSLSEYLSRMWKVSKNQ